MEIMILDRLTTLGHAQRMAVFRLLVRRYPDAVPAGELAAALDIKPSTLSVYLAALKRVGLITQTRHGTSLRYCAEIAAVEQVMDYMFRDCCRGRGEMCWPLSEASASETNNKPKQKRNALFICTGNSTRSIFAEALLRREAGDRFEAYSAGTHAGSVLNPFAIALLQSKGHDTDLLRAKSIAEFQAPDAPEIDFVFTVCDQAANEECPFWPGQPISAHWGLPDPVKATGTDAEKQRAFLQAYEQLKNRIRAFAALPFDTLDRVSLQARVDEINKI
jgi:arsenate reductase